MVNKTRSFLLFLIIIKWIYNGYNVWTKFAVACLFWDYKKWCCFVSTYDWKNLKLKKYFWYYQDCHWWHSLNIHHKKFDLRWTWGTQIWNHCIDISNFLLIELDATKIVNVSPRNFNAFPRKPVTQWSKTWFQLNFIILSKVKLFP